MVCNIDESDLGLVNIKDLYFLDGISYDSTWKYHHRREMQEIVPGVFLGPYGAAAKSKFQSLKASRITHIICVRSKMEACAIKQNFPNDFRYLVLDIADSMSEDIMRFFHLTKMFIDEALNGNGKVLVHGLTGCSRSAALVMAYIMQTYDPNFQKAYETVQKKRYCVTPNSRFIMQLIEFEAICEARKQINEARTANESSMDRGLKRPFED